MRLIFQTADITKACGYSILSTRQLNGIVELTEAMQAASKVYPETYTSQHLTVFSNGQETIVFEH
jgi:hypothetical protein